jgi:hypothetical protein
MLPARKPRRSPARASGGDHEALDRQGPQRCQKGDRVAIVMGLDRGLEQAVEAAWERTARDPVCPR